MGNGIPLDRARHPGSAAPAAKEALELAKEILRESEHPRAVEVYSGLLANVAKINSQILELSKIHKDITDRKSYKDAPQQLPAPNPGTTNNVFVGSVTELQAMLKDARESDLVDVTPENE